MTCLATLRHNAAEAAAERGMSAFGRGRVRTLLLTGLSAAAMACAASLGFADAQSPPGPFGADLGAQTRTSAPLPLEFTRGSHGRVSSPLAGEDQGGGSRYPTQQASGDACDNGLRDPPPPLAPTRGGGCANAIGSVEKSQVMSPEA